MVGELTIENNKKVIIGAFKNCNGLTVIFHPVVGCSKVLNMSHEEILPS